ncbi:MAG TPA: ABC transporter permease [Roseomonas sp.]|jgi:peptide/nickel transport system permease protein
MIRAAGWVAPPLRAIALILAIAIIAFFCIRAVPGDVVDVLATQGDLTAAQQAAMRQSMGLDASLPAQFLAWAGQALQGEFGSSLRFGKPVAELFLNALPATLHLGLLAFAIGLALALVLALGALAAPRSPLPFLVQAVNVWSIAVPTFCIGIAGILVFSIWLGWLPAIGGFGLPSAILGIDIAGQLVKPLHDELRQARAAPHVRTARAKGLHPLRIGLFHLLPTAMPVLLALSSVVLAGVLGGTLTLEVLFGLPGVGSLALNAVYGRDWPLLQATIVFLAAGVVLINAGAELLHRLLDPRPRR